MNAYDGPNAIERGNGTIVRVCRFLTMLCVAGGSLWVGFKVQPDPVNPSASVMTLMMSGLFAVLLTLFGIVTLLHRNNGSAGRNTPATVWH